MIYKINKNIILESYDSLVKKRLDLIGLGKEEDRISPDKEVNKIVKQQDVDDSKPATEYFNTIYNNKELKNLEDPGNKLTARDLKIPTQS